MICLLGSLLLAALTVAAALLSAGTLGHGGRPLFFFFLRTSFWALKILERPLRLRPFDPERMVVEMNNVFMEKHWPSSRADGILLLIPHCLQNHVCTHRLTFDIDACERCGRCPVGELLELRDRFGVKMAVATGGTAARRILRDVRPDMVVAVACPRDLSLGILDAHPVPAWGQLNEWPEGPCFDTWVDTDEVARGLSVFAR
ncbi:DUF116 domain-containing protein [Candidatus Fermentibacteria bacterium]|nr:DUF116 domain-containing protein [Candidatus Fermentibacteria bacterium]